MAWARAIYIFPVRETISIERYMRGLCIFPRQGNHINRRTCTSIRNKIPYGAHSSTINVSLVIYRVHSLTINVVRVKNRVHFLTINVSLGIYRVHSSTINVLLVKNRVSHNESADVFRIDSMDMNALTGKVETRLYVLFPRQGNHINRRTCTDTRTKTP
jgi:hypothetical protein